MNIRELADQAGLDWHRGWTLDNNEPNRFSVFAELVAAHERKECIEAIQELLSEVENQPIQSAATKKFVVQVAHFVSEPMIEVIRARGTR